MFKKHLSRSDFMIDKVFIDRHWLPAFRQACLQRPVAAHELCWSFVMKMDGDGLDKRRGRGGETLLVSSILSDAVPVSLMNS